MLEAIWDLTICELKSIPDTKEPYDVLFKYLEKYSIPINEINEIDMLVNDLSMSYAKQGYYHGMEYAGKIIKAII